MANNPAGTKLRAASLLPALLSGPLGTVFSWIILRIEKKALKQDRRTMQPDSGGDSLPAPHVVSEPAKHAGHASYPRGPAHRVNTLPCVPPVRGGVIDPALW